MRQRNGLRAASSRAVLSRATLARAALSRAALSRAALARAALARAALARAALACAAFCLAALAAASPAPAFTLGGAIVSSSGGGAFVKLDPSDGFAVGADTFQDPNLYAFDEDQNILLDRDIRVDIGAETRVIPAGSVVASHYVFFDPGFGAWQVGYVEFDAPILGVAVFQSTLKATDFLANTQVTYLNPTLRGLEIDDAVWIDRDNPARLNVRWIASSPGDYVRVFTAASPSV